MTEQGEAGLEVCVVWVGRLGGASNATIKPVLCFHWLLSSTDYNYESSCHTLIHTHTRVRACPRHRLAYVSD